MTQKNVNKSEHDIGDKALVAIIIICLTMMQCLGKC